MKSRIAEIIPFFMDETGGTTMEYALIAALTIAVLALVATQLQESLTGSFDQQKDYFEGSR